MVWIKQRRKMQKIMEGIQILGWFQRAFSHLENRVIQIKTPQWELWKQELALNLMMKNISIWFGERTWNVNNRNTWSILKTFLQQMGTIPGPSAKPFCDARMEGTIRTNWKPCNFASYNAAKRSSQVFGVKQIENVKSDICTQTFHPSL